MVYLFRVPHPRFLRVGARWSKIGVGLLGVFGLLALGLAAVGLYGIMAYSVSQRRREIGVHMALGAGQRDVSLFILRQGMTVVFSGLALGGALAFLLGRALSRFLDGASQTGTKSLCPLALRTSPPTR
jgi:ABC-type antimicrobial peptide transport system permease subunit